MFTKNQFTVALAALLFGATVGRSQEIASSEGVEVLARGPVHEGYAEAIAVNPQATVVVSQQPPDLLNETPAAQRPAGEDVQWIPGYWAWDEDRSNYLWVTGFWRVPPPNRRWVPGHWSQDVAGWRWVPGFWALRDQHEIAYYPPPPAPLDSQASVPAPNEQSLYDPGCWIYRESRYCWRPGIWRACRPGWVWVPAHYVWSPCGYVFIDGYWDRALQDRGLLFAPVSVDLAYYHRSNYCFQPTYVVNCDCLFGALFVRPLTCHYYFGDYFEPRYRDLGFTAWCDFRVGRTCFDPLFCYYRWDHRHDHVWERGVRDLYVARYNGEVARPPQTLVQQNIVVQNIVNNQNTTNITNVNNVTNINNVRNVTMVASLSQVHSAGVALQPVNQEQQRQYQGDARQIREVSGQRTRLEGQAGVQNASPVQGAAPRVMKLALAPAIPQRTGSPARVSSPAPTSSVRTLSNTGNHPSTVTPQTFESRPSTTPPASSPANRPLSVIRNPAPAPEQRPARDSRPSQIPASPRPAFGTSSTFSPGAPTRPEQRPSRENRPPQVSPPSRQGTFEPRPPASGATLPSTTNSALRPSTIVQPSVRPTVEPKPFTENRRPPVFTPPAPRPEARPLAPANRPEMRPTPPADSRPQRFEPKATLARPEPPRPVVRNVAPVPAPARTSAPLPQPMITARPVPAPRGVETKGRPGAPAPQRTVSSPHGKTDKHG